MFITILGIGIGVLISGEIWIPILYRLQVVSIYEYFELRYKSKFPRRLMTAIFVLKVPQVGPCMGRCMGGGAWDGGAWGGGACVGDVVMCWGVHK